MSEHLEEKEDDKPSDAGLTAINGLVGTLQGTLGGLQNALASACSNMMGNLSQNMQMVATMNSMMEELLSQSLRIVSEVRSSSHGGGGDVRIQLRVVNSCRLPIRNIRLKMRFFPRGTEEDVAVTAAVSQAAEHAGLSDEILAGQPFDLNGQCTVTGLMSISLPEVNQYNVHVAASFPSPGTDVELVSTAQFGIYLVHQLRIISIPEEGMVVPHEALCVDVDSMLVRRLFQVPGSMGLLGRVYTLGLHQLAEPCVMCATRGVLDDLEKVQLLLWDSPPLSTGRLGSLSASVVKDELLRLASAVTNL
eukprot:GILK01009852.1.p1 GENE.GILK01009852.1~~GILK01009852.1.p1  ORF type:complete len:348 (-),score=60.69 GILK01009852.1:122-1039(-)